MTNPEKPGAKTAGGPQAKDHSITITDGQVDNDKVKAKKNVDSVKWTSSDYHYKVFFLDTSPFSSGATTIDVPQGGDSTPEQIGNVPTVDYPYEVRRMDMPGSCTDPTIKVDP